MNNYNPMMGQQGVQGFGYNPAFGGTRYGYQQPQNINFSQPLTPEEMKELATGNNGKFSLIATREEELRGKCTHKDPRTNNIALRDNNDGTCTCMICGETFTLLPLQMAGSAEVDDIVRQYNDLLNSIKTYYLTCGNKTIEDYFSMMPFANKAADFFKEAVNCFNRYCGGYNGVTADNDQYGWGMLGAMTTPGFGNPMMNAGYAGNPVNNFAYGQPQMPQQQYYDPQQQVGVNPFGYNGAVQQPAYGQQQPAPTAYFQQPAYGQQQQSQQQQAVAYGQPQVPQQSQQQAAPYGQQQTEQVSVNNNGQVVATKTTEAK